MQTLNTNTETHTFPRFAVPAVLVAVFLGIIGIIWFGIGKYSPEATTTPATGSSLDGQFASFIVMVALIVVGCLMYFLPAIAGKSKRNAAAIFALNLFLGWTVIGWVVALVWALTVDGPELKVV